MAFPHGQTFTRLRAPMVTDPYSSTATLPDWPNAAALEIDGFGFDPGGSVTTDTVNRTQTVTTPTLIWWGSDVPDVLAGDRVRDEYGRVWHVAGNPSRPVNPWTGWQPGASWPLELVEG